MRSVLALAALFAAFALGCSTPTPGSEGDYCTDGAFGVPCQAGLVCNTYNICQQPVGIGGACMGPVCEAGLQCFLDPSSTTGLGSCLPSNDE